MKDFAGLSKWHNNMETYLIGHETNGLEEAVEADEGIVEEPFMLNRHPLLRTLSPWLRCSMAWSSWSCSEASGRGWLPSHPDVFGDGGRWTPYLYRVLYIGPSNGWMGSCLVSLLGPAIKLGHDRWSSARFLPLCDLNRKNDACPENSAQRHEQVGYFRGDWPDGFTGQSRPLYFTAE